MRKYLIRIAVCLFFVLFSATGCALDGGKETTPPTTGPLPKEAVQPDWEAGGLSASGEEADIKTRLRTSEYLLLADYGGAVINPGYTLSWYVYDENRVFLGRGDSGESGEGFSVQQIQDAYPAGVLFRVALGTDEGVALIREHGGWSHVLFYGPGSEAPAPEVTVSQEQIAKIFPCQDGAIYNGKLFLFNAKGSFTVYDLETRKQCGYVFFSMGDALIPHANSVCFSNRFYEEGDTYPLLYANIYNNYSDQPDRMEGTCCVYRLTEDGSGFDLSLVQVIRIGFTEDLNLWRSASKNWAPFGNFVVDTDRSKLYAYVMRNDSSSTRFFVFNLPAVTDGVYSEEYGCNMVTLEQTDYHAMFDTEFSYYIQGSCYHGGKIFSLEGMDSGAGKEPALRIIDAESGTLEKTFYLAEAALFREPEMISFDPDTGILYYAGYDSVLRTLTIPGYTDGN